MTAYDDAQALRAALDRDAQPDLGLHEYATALIVSVEDLYDGTVTERIGKMIRDENGLPLTSAAMHVLVSVLTAIDIEDTRWNLPGTPSVTDYAASVIARLRRNCSTPVVRL